MISQTLNFERLANSNQTSFLSLSSVEHRNFPLYAIFQTNDCFPLSLNNRNYTWQKMAVLKRKKGQGKDTL